MNTQQILRCLRALAALFMGIVSPAHAGVMLDSPRFDGSFLQLTESHRQWKPEDWAALMAEMKDLGLDFLIVQWTAYDGSNFAAAAGDDPDAGPSTLDRLLQAADRTRMGIYVGLLQDSDYWSRIKLDPASVEVYLQQLRRRELALAEQLAPGLKAHRSVRGWFITEEIDDINWRDRAHRTLLFNHLGVLSSRLDGLLPGGKVALSGFANGVVDPKTFAVFWGSLLQAAKNVDIVLFQDGVGVNKLRPPEVPIYLKTLAASVQTAGRDLWTIVEIFQEVQGSRKPGDAFRAEPAPIDRINRQMELAGPYSSRLVAFSIPEYMSTRAGPGAEQLLRDYRSQRRLDMADKQR